MASFKIKLHNYCKQKVLSKVLWKKSLKTGVMNAKNFGINHIIKYITKKSQLSFFII